MEKNCKTKVSHKEWRRIAKKERRRRLRREDARRRYGEEERQSAALELSADDLKLREEKEKLEMEIEAREQQERERQWLKEEVNMCFKEMLDIDITYSSYFAVFSVYIELQVPVQSTENVGGR